MSTPLTMARPCPGADLTGLPLLESGNQIWAAPRPRLRAGLAPSPGRGAKPQRRAWVTFQGPANLAAPQVKAGARPAASPAPLTGMRQRLLQRHTLAGRMCGQRQPTSHARWRHALPNTFFLPGAPAPPPSSCTWSPASRRVQMLPPTLLTGSAAMGGERGPLCHSQFRVKTQPHRVLSSKSMTLRLCTSKLH